MAPLGWGLGHATRCIPLIRELHRQGAIVVLASDGDALALLRQTFPDLHSFELPGYNVKYKAQSMTWNMAWQLPKIIRAIWLEHRLLRHLVKSQGIDGIISDNRFGCFASKKRSIFLTHQVNIQVPFFLANRAVNYLNHLIVKQFDECWIPDVASIKNLSGELSHPIKPRLRAKAKYIGALSQLEKSNAATKRYDAIVVLSGPEPQRTRLEKAIIEQAEHLEGQMLIVQGRPGQQREASALISKNIEIVASMTGEQLQQAILKSSVFIGRSGYSTVMDLARLGKPALLIPTPGQTEQEYLAAKFLRENVFYTQKQNALNLGVGILEAKKLTGLQGVFFDEKAVENAVATFLAAC